VVDRSAFDRIIQAGGYISVRSGAAPEASTILVPKGQAELAMDAAACIGCGACVAACPNGSASLFTSAKIAHLNLLPQDSLSANSASGAWSRRWIMKVLVTARCIVSMKQFAQKKSA
jgi:ferredoxin